LLLDRIFSEREEAPDLERRKQAARGKVYARQYLTLATKYFGAGMREDARRCYAEAIRHAPADSLSFTTARRVLATFIDPGAYRKVKTVFGRLVA